MIEDRTNRLPGLAGWSCERLDGVDCPAWLESQWSSNVLARMATPVVRAYVFAPSALISSQIPQPLSTQPSNHFNHSMTSVVRGATRIIAFCGACPIIQHIRRWVTAGRYSNVERNDVQRQLIYPIQCINTHTHTYTNISRGGCNLQSSNDRK